MLRGGIVVIIAILSVKILKRKLFRHHIVGLFLVVLGISLVGLSAVLSSDGSESTSSTGQQLIGIIIMVISLFLQSGIFFSEEMIMNKFHFEPAQVVGTEGCFGLTASVIVNIILTFTPVSDNFSQGSKYNGKTYIENAFLYFE